MIAEDFEAVSVVESQDGLDEEGDRVVSEIGGQVADADS